MIDYVHNVIIREDRVYKTILCCTLNLDKETMIKMLQNEDMMIMGVMYKTPIKTILNHLINDNYGNVYLEIEKIES